MVSKSPASYTVRGKTETIAALNRVEDFDRAQAARIAGERLIPHINTRTRALSGLLRTSWMMDEQYLSNEQDYAVIQEYGSVWVEATDAIRKAVDDNPDALLDGYSEVIDDAGDKAGFGHF